MSNLRVVPERLQVGDYLSDIQYYQVVKIQDKNIVVTNERGFESEIDKDIVAEGMYSASQYQTEKNVSRTEICEILEKAGNHIFTVNFLKQIKEKEIKDKLLQAIKSPDDSPLEYKAIEKALKQVSKTLLDGEPRTLIGHLLRVEPKVGRSLVIDLEVSSDQHRLRQVDHRTINWLILKNIKYVVK